MIAEEKGYTQIADSLRQAMDHAQRSADVASGASSKRWYALVKYSFGDLVNEKQTNNDINTNNNKNNFNDNIRKLIRASHCRHNLSISYR